MKTLYFSLLTALFSVLSFTVFSQYQVSNTTVNSCIGSVSESNAQGTFLFTIDIANCDSIDFEIQISDLKNTDHLIVYDGGQGSSQIANYSNINSQENYSISSTSASNGNITLEYYQQNSNTTNSFTVLWQGILAHSEVIKDTICPLAADGSINLSFDETNFTSIQWSGNSNATTKNISSLDGGIYTINAKAESGCELKKTYTIYEPAPIAISATKIQDKQCYGTTNDGEIQLSASGGTPNYEYTLNGTTNSTGLFSGLDANSYSYLVTDAKGCIKNSVSDITIIEPEQITVVVDSSNYGGYAIKCNGDNSGRIKLQTSKGTPPYTYEWNKNGSFYSSDSELSNLTIGAYTCTITDANGCTDNSVNVTLHEPEILGFSETTKNNACFGEADGNVEILGTGGAGLPENFTYQWGVGQTGTSLTNLAAGNYYFTITDSAGCSLSNNIEITQPATAIVANASIIQNKLCNGGDNNGKAEITASGGYETFTYKWNVDSTTSTISNLNIGSYWCTVTDSEGCSKESNHIDISEPSEVLSASVKSKDYNGYGVSCNNSNNGEVYLSINGGTPNYTISWNNNAHNSTNDTVSTLEANLLLEYTVSDANSCETTGSITLTEPSVVSETAQLKSDYNLRNVKCFNDQNGWIEINGTGGVGSYTYVWDANALNQQNKKAENLGTGNYNYTITDANNCSFSNTATLTNAPRLSIDSISGSHVSVFNGNDGTLNIAVSNQIDPVSYKWSGNNVITTNQNQIELYAGFYHVTATDLNGCIHDTVFEITQPASLLGGEIEINNSNIEIVCDKVKPSSITEKTSSQGGSDPANYVYSWEYSFNNIDWAGNTFTNSNSVAYQIDSTLTQNIYVRRKVSDGATFSYSNTVFLNYIEPTSLAILNLDTAYCKADNAVTIQGVPYSPEALFIGTGISDLTGNKAEFDPALAPEGLNTITFAFTDKFGCQDTLEQQTYIRLNPTPSFDIQTPLIKSSTPELMTNISPSGGTFSGSGVIASDSSFISENLELNTYTITYTVENEFGCSASTTRNVELVIGAGYFKNSTTGESLADKFCIDDAPFNIEAIPTYTFNSGTYTQSATNINPKIGNINPQELGAGTHTIIFQYLTNDASDYEITKVITIYDIIDRSIISGLSSEYCNYKQIENISAVPLNGEGTGVFTGNGTLDYGNATAQFIVNNAGETPVGSPHTIQYQYTHTESGCTATDVKSVYVWNPVKPSFFTRDTFNIEETPQKFTNITPANGDFFGKSVEKTDSTFNPKSAGIGWHEISYAYQDEHTCRDTATISVYVDEARGTFYNLNSNNIYCFKGEADTIYVNTENGLPGGVFSGGAIINHGTDSAIIIPKNFTPGLHTITYQYKGLDNITSFALTTDIYIDDLGNLSIQFPASDTSFCIDAALVSLQGLINGNEASYGEFSGNNGILTGTTNDGKASLSAALAGIGEHNVVYTINSKYTGSSCSDYISKKVTVTALPEITFPLSTLYNSKGNPDTLKALPVGGTYTAEGVSSDGIFNPAIPSLGQHSIVYTYTDSNGCSSTMVKQTRIQSASGSFTNLNNLYCYLDENHTISVQVDNSNGQNGSFFGNGIIDNGDNTAIFNPKQAYDLNNDNIAKIKDTIFFEYLGTNDTTKFTIFKVIELVNLGTAEIIGFNKDQFYCLNHNIQELNGTPSGGIFTADQGLVNDNFFDPSKALIGFNNITYTYTDEASACSISKTLAIKVEDLPEISFQAPTHYCKNSSSTVLVGDPRNGLFLEEFLDELDGQKDSVLFDPSEHKGIKTITYQYQDPSTSCINTYSTDVTIDTIPDIGFYGNLPEDYCINKSSFELQAALAGELLNDGKFFGSSSVFDTDTTDGKAEFNPQFTTIGTDTVFFTFTDGNGCTNTVSTEIELISPTEASFGFPIQPSYCKIDSNINVIGSPSTNGTLIIDDVAYNNISDLSLNLGSFENSDEVTITYRFTDANTCTDDTTVLVTLLDVPSVNFEISDYCIASPIEFTPITDFSENQLQSYWWSFGEADSTTNVSNPFYKFSADGNKTISLRLIAQNGCLNQIDSIIEFQSNPKALFEWRNECQEGGKVEFRNNTVNASVYSNKWNFGDEESSDLVDAKHSYSNEGKYPVTLTVKSQSSECIDSITKMITVRPQILLNEDKIYIESFEDTTNHFWIPDNQFSVNSSWEIGIPKGKIIQQASEGKNVWATSLDSNYNFNENSFLVSPCFDFTDLEKPMISFNLLTQIEENRDGVVLQYLIDDGSNWYSEATWNNIGAINQGINWYNSFDVASRPGNSSQAWTATTDSLWLNARHDLQHLKGEQNVRFRLAFASDNLNQNEGIAIDNIQIKNRERRVLIEHFTNSEQNKDNAANNTINNLVDQLPLDFIDIQYHTSYPNGDEFYNTYPAGAESRSLYYNIDQTPFSIIDGSYTFDFQTGNPELNFMKVRSLTDPEMNINLEVEKNTSSINCDFEISSNGELTNEDLFLYVAVVEKSVKKISNSTIEYQNVLRTMLPDPSGLKLKKNWTTSDKERLQLSWSYNNYNSDNLNVVAFIQNSKQKVLQAVTSDTTSTEVGINEFLANQKEMFMLYPNPAKTYTNILLLNSNSKKTITVINQQGIKVYSSLINEQTQNYKLKTSVLPQGLYYISIDEGGKKYTKKLIIQ